MGHLFIQLQVFILCFEKWLIKNCLWFVPGAFCVQEKALSFIFSCFSIVWTHNVKISKVASLNVGCLPSIKGIYLQALYV